MTRKIPLTRGYVALVDDDMYDYLMQWKWTATNRGYAARYETIPITERHSKRRQRVVYMHHIILGGVSETDHINHNRADNQRHNLRRVTRRQNVTNTSKRQNTSSKYIGVCLYKHINRWGAQVQIDGKTIYLGCFKTEIEAAKVRDAAAHKQYGEYAVLNFPEDYR